MNEKNGANYINLKKEMLRQEKAVLIFINDEKKKI